MRKYKLRELVEVPAIEVFYNQNGHISIRQDAGSICNEEQLITVDRSRIEVLIDMLRAVAKEYDEDPPSPFVEEEEDEAEGESLEQSALEQK